MPGLRRRRGPQHYIRFEVAVVALDVGGGIDLEAVVVDGIDLLVAGDAQRIADVERLLQQQFQTVLGELADEIFRAVRGHGLPRALRGDASHTFTVLSSLAEARRLPSGLKHTLVTYLVCPLRVRATCPVTASCTFGPPHPRG